MHAFAQLCLFDLSVCVLCVAQVLMAVPMLMAVPARRRAALNRHALTTSERASERLCSASRVELSVVVVIVGLTLRM